MVGHRRPCLGPACNVSYVSQVEYAWIYGYKRPRLDILLEAGPEAEEGQDLFNSVTNGSTDVTTPCGLLCEQGE